MTDAAAQKAWDQKWVERLAQSVGTALGWRVEKAALYSPQSDVSVVLKVSLGTTKHMQKHERPKPDEMDVEVRGAYVWPALAKVFSLTGEKAPLLQFMPNGRGPFRVFRYRRQASVVDASAGILAVLPPLAEAKADAFVTEKLLPLLRSQSLEKMASSRANDFMPAPAVDFAALFAQAPWSEVQPAGMWRDVPTFGWNAWPDKTFGPNGGGTEYREWLGVGAALGLAGMKAERDALRDAWLSAHAPERRVSHSATCGCFGCSEASRVLELERRIF